MAHLCKEAAGRRRSAVRPESSGSQFARPARSRAVCRSLMDLRQTNAALRGGPRQRHKQSMLSERAQLIVRRTAYHFRGMKK
jgi:hypothetical protein